MHRIWAVAGTPQSASSFGIGISMIVCASMRTLAAALEGSGKLCLRWACAAGGGTRNAYEKKSTSISGFVASSLREGVSGTFCFAMCLVICLPFSA